MATEMPTAEELEWLETEAEELEWLETETETAETTTRAARANPPNPPKSSKRAREEQAASQSNSRDGDDEEWLRYSPLPPPPPQPPTKQSRRICISRFASDVPGDCFPITGPHGRRVYAQLNPTSNPSPNLQPQHPPAALLPQSIHTLIQRVERTAFSKALQESSSGPPPPPAPAPPTTEARLWVDKYAPGSFTELLSDEHTNREVLFWLKQWDFLVFGSHVRATADGVLSALRMHSSVAPSSRNFFPKHHTRRHLPSTDQNATHYSGSNKCLADRPPEHKVPISCEIGC